MDRAGGACSRRRLGPSAGGAQTLLPDMYLCNAVDGRDQKNPVRPVVHLIRDDPKMTATQSNPCATPRLDSQTSQVHVDAVAEVVRHVLGYRLQRRVSRSCHESRRRLEADIAHA